MSKSAKILLYSFLISLVFWLGADKLAKNLEDFFYWQNLSGNKSYLLTAELNQKLLETKLLEAKNKIEPEIKAESAISVEINNKGEEKILFEKNSGQPLPIASLTKLMTALVIFDFDETYKPDQLITISKEAVMQEGSSKYGDLMVGEKLSVEILLHIMLIESSNDAAFALAQPLGENGFVDIMNLYAEDIGLKNTHFANPTGLEPDNLSTVKDLTKLTKYILENYPGIFSITDLQSYEALRPDKTLHHFIPQNTNELLAEFPEIIGGKTGYSPQAKGCLLLILANPKNSSYFINVILGSDDRFGEMKKLVEAMY